MRGSLTEYKLIVVIISLAIAALSWYVSFILVSHSALDQIYVANQVKSGIYAVSISPYDQELHIDFSQQKNFSVVIKDNVVGILPGEVISFSYEKKMNIPEAISVIGILPFNFSNVCIRRTNDLIEVLNMSECV